MTKLTATAMGNALLSDDPNAPSLLRLMEYLSNNLIQCPARLVTEGVRKDFNTAGAWTHESRAVLVAALLGVHPSQRNSERTSFPSDVAKTYAFASHCAAALGRELNYVRPTIKKHLTTQVHDLQAENAELRARIAILEQELETA